jgi:ankyrin repeat protein
MAGTGPILWVAASEGRANDVKKLLSGSGVDPEVKGGILHSTALHISSHKGHLMVVLHLIDCGAAISARDRDGWTPLHYACFQNHLSIVLLLLHNGADICTKDNSGMTPLMVVARMGNYALAEVLLHKRAEINTSDHKGMTPLHYCVLANSASLVSLFIAHGADVQAVTSTGQTSDVLASGLGYTLVAMVLKQSVTNQATSKMVAQTPPQQSILVLALKSSLTPPFKHDRLFMMVESLARQIVPK